MAFDKKALKGFMKDAGVTQRELADMVAKDIRTVRRWLSPKHRLTPRAIRAICDALNVPPERFDPDWDGNAATGQEIQIGARVSVAAANGYRLLREQYGVSTTDIVEIAPVLFAVIAGRACLRGERRVQRIEEIEKRAAALGMSIHYSMDVAREMEWAEKAIELGSDSDIFCTSIFDRWGGEAQYLDYTPNNLFADEILELCEGDNRVSGSVGNCPTSRGFLFFSDYLEKLTSGNQEMKDAIRMGKVNIAKMDDHLLEESNEGQCPGWWCRRPRAEPLA